MKKIIFKGLGPFKTVTHEGKILKDGAVLSLDEATADAYIKAGFAIEVKSEEQQELEQKHVKKRNDIRKEIEENNKKEGDK